MRILHAICFLATLFTLGFAPRANACSLGPDFFSASNYELVRDTSAIVLATSVAWVKDDSMDGPQIRMRVDEVLKGPIKEMEILVDGVDNFAGRTEETDLDGVRDGWRRGMCNAYDYRTGHRYVLFLRYVEPDPMITVMSPFKAGWSVSGPAISRINEEVNGASSPWVVAIRHYTRIAALNDYDREKQALLELRQKAGKAASSHYPRALVADIDRHLSSPHPSKSYEDLLEMFRNAPDDNKRQRILWAFAVGKHAKAAPLIRQILDEGPPPNLLDPCVKYVEQTKDASAVPRLAVIYPSVADGWKRELTRRALLAAAGPAEEPILFDLLTHAQTDDEIKAFAYWFGRHSSRRATAWLEEFAQDRHIFEPTSTPSDRLVIGTLAGAGVRPATDWALAYASRTGNDRKIAMEALARSPFPDADLVVQSLIRSSAEEDLWPLLSAFNHANHPWVYARLEQVYRDRAGSHEVQEQVALVLKHRADAGEAEATQLLKRLTQ